MIHKKHGNNSADFSDDMKYRYLLRRRWNEFGPLILFVLLNPSTADEAKNDATVERCQRRAVKLNYGQMIVTNIFAWRSTDPEVLKTLEDPVGPDNDRAIIFAAGLADMVLCGWGKNGQIRNRGRQVLDMLHISGFDTYCLRQNSDCSPEHPLYIPYSQLPAPIA